MDFRHDRQYELVLFGATGYTGKHCAEHIITHLPANLDWAIAGRNHGKLSALKKELHPLNPNRLPPRQLGRGYLDRLAKKTRLIINTVGPYSLYGSAVVEACAINGTHYLDVTGEFPWVLDMIKKHHDTAKQHGAIMIPQIGMASAPADLTTWALASLINQTLHVGTKEVICCLYALKSQPSGGSLATALGIFDTYSLKQLSEAGKPYALSAMPGSKPSRPRPLLEKLTGVRMDPTLGALTTAVTASSDTPIVERSWSLLSDIYGLDFEFNEYQMVRNVFVAITIKVLYAVAMIGLILPPVRWLLKMMVYAPGQGASKEAGFKESIEFRALAIADQNTHNPRRAMARMHYKGRSMYYMAGFLLAEAAMTILREPPAVGPSIEEKLRGGLLTPACLGQAFIDRLNKIEGFSLTAEMVDA
ncbi:MAG: hypothetical protein M1835_004057 [Candelina submexicana]|nr:MAG: hypothetical protein M1835_004057 [Candelina submexicana]